MINIDDRLLKEVDSDELWLLCQIVKKLNSKMFCFPSNKTLLVDTGWSLKKLQRVKKSLKDNKMLDVEASFNSDRQTSNRYFVTTELIGVYVTADKISRMTPNYSPSESNLTMDGMSQEDATEVLTSNEVLTSESKDSVNQKYLFSDEEVLNKKEGQKESKKTRAKEKTVDPAFLEFIRIWMEAYPDLGFSPVDGKKIKSLIDKTKKYLVAGGKESNTEAALAMFQYVVNYLKRGDTWFAGKDLAVIDSKYLSIIFEIKNGKQRTSKAPSARDIINSL